MKPIDEPLFPTRKYDEDLEPFNPREIDSYRKIFRSLETYENMTDILEDAFKFLDHHEVRNLLLEFDIDQSYIPEEFQIPECHICNKPGFHVDSLGNSFCKDCTKNYFKEIQKPIVKAPKIGRNDPCPCGSGLKYKKCCIDK